MSTRLNIQQQAPDALKAMLDLEAAVAQCNIPNGLRALIKMRASVINNCRYCLEMHTPWAQEQGFSEAKITAIQSWSASSLFNPQEQAVLALTDEVTQIHLKGLKTTTYLDALEQLGEPLLASCIMQISVINGWNRIAIATGMEH